MKKEADNTEVMDTDCLEAMDHLYAYLNNELEDRVLYAKVEEHIAHCRSCFSRAEIERELNNRIRQSGKEETPISLQNRLDQIIKKL